MNAALQRINYSKLGMIVILAAGIVLFERMTTGMLLAGIAWMLYQRRAESGGVIKIPSMFSGRNQPSESPARKLAEVIPLNNSFAPAWKDADDFLQATLDVLRTRFEFQTANIFLRGEDKTSLVQRAFLSSTNSVARLAVIKVGHGLVGWVAANKRPLVAGNLRHEAGSLGYYRGAATISSFAAVPMIINGEVVGVIAIDHSKQNAFRAPDTEQALSAVAALLARVLGNEERCDVATREADRIRETRRILRASWTAPDVDAAAQSALREMIGLGNFHAAACYLLDEKKSPSRRATIGFNGVWANEVKEPIMRRAASQAIAQSSPFRVENVALLAQYRAHSTRGPIPELLMALPILHRGEALGALVVEFADRHIYDARMEGILSDVVSELGSALLRVYSAVGAEGAAREGSRLTNLSSECLSSRTPEEVWEKLFAFTRAEMKSTGAAAWKRERSEFIVEAVAGASIKNESFPANEGLLNWTLLAGRPVIASREDIHRLPVDDGESFLLLPITVDGEARRVVTLVAEEKSAFSADDVERAREIGVIVGAVLGMLDRIQAAERRAENAVTRLPAHNVA